MSIQMGVYYDDHPHAGGHFTDIEALDAIERVIIAGPDAAHERAEAMEKAEYLEDGWRGLLDDDAIPAVCVLTNNRDAGRMTLEAVERGKYVYADKPGARTAEEMARIVEAAEQTGAHYCPCYVRRTFSETREMRRLLQAGAIGDLWSFQATWVTSQASLRGVENWLFSDELAGGGIVYWLACHWLDTLKFVTGSKVTAVSAMVATQNPDITVEDVACLNLRLDNGAVGSIRAGYLLDPFPAYEDNDLMMAFEGSAGSLAYMPRGPVTLRLRTRAEGFGPAGETRAMCMHENRPGGYALALLQDFVEAVTTGREPLVTEQDALYVLRVAEAAYESSRTGTEEGLTW
jgi:predicted dehydrogenase